MKQQVCMKSSQCVLSSLDRCLDRLSLYSGRTFNEMQILRGMFRAHEITGRVTFHSVPGVSGMKINIYIYKEFKRVLLR